MTAPWSIDEDTDGPDLPLVLARIHAALAVDAEVVLSVPRTTVDAARLDDLVVGGGFAPTGPTRTVRTTWVVPVVRRRTLADTVGPEMRLLVCGLNPSVHAADAGVGFARSGNRFWPAALGAGLVTVDRQPIHALLDHGVGMTDLVKRATPRADALTAADYAQGLDRMRRLVTWLAPGAVCFVGLAGWRSAADRRAVPGPQPSRLGGVAVYVMPSTSGVNARVGPDELTDHLRAALTLADAERAAR